VSEGNSEIAKSQGCETGVGRRYYRAILSDLSLTIEFARVITETGKRDSGTW